MLKNKGGQKSTWLKRTNKCKTTLCSMTLCWNYITSMFTQKSSVFSHIMGAFLHMCFLNENTPTSFLLCDVNHWTSWSMTLGSRESLMKYVCSQHFVSMHSTCKNPTKFQLKIFEENNYLYWTGASAFPCCDPWTTQSNKHLHCKNIIGGIVSNLKMMLGLEGWVSVTSKAFGIWGVCVLEPISLRHQETAVYLYWLT